MKEALLIHERKLQCYSFNSEYFTQGPQKHCSKWMSQIAVKGNQTSLWDYKVKSKVKVPSLKKQYQAMLHQDKPLKLAGAVLDVLGLALLQCPFSWITITMENVDAGVCHPYPGCHSTLLMGFSRPHFFLMGFSRPITSCAAKMEKGFRKSPGVTAGLPRTADSRLLPKWPLQDKEMSCPWGADGREAVRAGFH